MTRREEIKQEAARDGRDPKTRRLLLILAVITTVSALLTGGLIWFSWSQARDEAQAGQNLAVQIEEACAARSEIPVYLKDICSDAGKVAEGQVGPSGPIGPQGPPGPAGPAGPFGPQGLAGIAGVEGDPGRNGRIGPSGTDGSDGTDGAIGPVGPTGPEGAAGPAGPQGEQGPAGQDGTDGQPPATFTWDDGVFSYSCSDPDGDSHYSCERSGPAPDQG